MTRSMDIVIKKDQNGNVIYHRDSAGIEQWWDYDEYNRLIKHRDSEGNVQ